MTLLMKLHTLGHDFVPDPIHAGKICHIGIISLFLLSFCRTFFFSMAILVAGGLGYHRMAPLISHVYELGFMEAVAIPQTECFQGIWFLAICL